MFLQGFCLLQLSPVRLAIADDAWLKSAPNTTLQEIILRNQAVSAAVRAQNWPKALRIPQEAHDVEPRAKGPWDAIGHGSKRPLRSADGIHRSDIN